MGRSRRLVARNLSRQKALAEWEEVTARHRTLSLEMQKYAENDPEFLAKLEVRAAAWCTSSGTFNPFHLSLSTFETVVVANKPSSEGGGFKLLEIQFQVP